MEGAPSSLCGPNRPSPPLAGRPGGYKESKIKIKLQDYKLQITSRSRGTHMKRNRRLLRRRLLLEIAARARVRARAFARAHLAAAHSTIDHAVHARAAHTHGVA